VQFAKAAVVAPRATGLLTARWVWGVAAITVAAGILRWPTLAGGSFWYDEWLVHNIVYARLDRLSAVIRHQQTTPPVYYYVAWAWAKVFGPGADSLRALSGLFGVATVPIAFAATAVIATRRAAFVAAALVAVNPFLIWYSVEARPYALLAFLSAVSLLLFALALRRPSWPVVVAWGLSCALMLATHYYAVFLVAAETLVLLVALRRRRSMLVALAAVVLAGLAVAPLALRQRAGTEWISTIPLDIRVEEFVKGFLIGVSPFSVRLFWPLAALALVGAMLAWRGTRTERRAAAITAGVGALTLALAFVPVAFGTDTLLDRNLIPALPAFLLALGIGFGSERAGVGGLLGAAGVCAVSIALVVAIPLDRDLQRVDWSAAAGALPPQHDARLVVTWSGYRAQPMFGYLPGLGDPQPSESQVAVKEIDILALRERGKGFACWSGAVCGEQSVDFPRRPRLMDFRLAAHHRAAGFDVVTYRARRPTKVAVLPLYYELSTWVSANFPRIFIQHAPPKGSPDPAT
jgi:hypothetical protein